MLNNWPAHEWKEDAEADSRFTYSLITDLPQQQPFPLCIATPKTVIAPAGVPPLFETAADMMHGPAYSLFLYNPWSPYSFARLPVASMSVFRWAYEQETGERMTKLVRKGDRARNAPQWKPYIQWLKSKGYLLQEFQGYNGLFNPVAKADAATLDMLLALMQEKSLTREGVAKGCNVSERTVYRWITGESSVPVEIFTKLKGL